MAKYNLFFKQHALEFYLQNGKNQSLTRRHFQLNETRLKHWIRQYNHSGINGVSLGFTDEDREMIIEDFVVKALADG